MFPCSPGPDNHFSTLCFYESDDFFFKIRDAMQYLSFSLWFTSLSVVPSSSIHVVTNGRISLFLTAGPYSIVHVFHRGSHFFIHSSTDAHLAWFRSLVTVDNATTIMEEQVPLQDAVFISGMCLVTAVVVGAQIWRASISVSGGKARNGEDNPGEPGFFFFCSLNFLNFPGGAVDKNPPANAGDMGLIPGLGLSHMPQGS